MCLLFDYAKYYITSATHGMVIPPKIEPCGHTQVHGVEAFEIGIAIPCVQLVSLTPNCTNFPCVIRLQSVI